jgi:mRNA interferase MazF
MTTGSRPAPSRIPIRFDGKPGFILLEQIRTLEKRRLMRRLRVIGGGDSLSAALATLREIFED